MKALVMSFRRGRHTYKPRQFIVQTEKVKNRKDAEKHVGKEVTWKSPAGKLIKGKITAAHGNKGLLRVVFEKGLPGQAINTGVEIK